MATYKVTYLDKDGDVDSVQTYHNMNDDTLLNVVRNMIVVYDYPFVKVHKKHDDDVDYRNVTNSVLYYLRDVFTNVFNNL